MWEGTNTSQNPLEGQEATLTCATVVCSCCARKGQSAEVLILLPDGVIFHNLLEAPLPRPPRDLNISILPMGFPSCGGNWDTYRGGPGLRKPTLRKLGPRFGSRCKMGPLGPLGP